MEGTCFCVGNKNQNERNGRVWGPSVGQGLGPPKRPGPKQETEKKAYI